MSLVAFIVIVVFAGVLFLGLIFGLAAYNRGITANRRKTDGQDHLRTRDWTQHKS